MKEYDDVLLIAEKECYAKYGVHKGMQGIVCYPKNVEGYTLVEFPLYADGGYIAAIAVRDEDLDAITAVDPWVNDRIRAEYEKKA